jgi:hypothetical protein
MNRFIPCLIAAASTAVFLMAGPAKAADAKPSFVPPAFMVQNWAKFSEQMATGRIKEVAPFSKHAQFAPCTADATLCKMITDHLSILTVEVAKFDGQTIVWLVSVPTETKPKVGYNVQFTFPEQPKGLGAGVYDKTGNLVFVPKCTWGKDGTLAESSPTSEGVLCETWRYGELPYFQVAKPAPAPVPAQPAAVPASQP